MKKDTTPLSHGAKYMAALTVILALVASCILPVAVQAQAPDPYEPDELDPPWIANDEFQERSFYPEGDVDYARFRIKAGHWYDVHTRDLAPLVDTALTVEFGGLVYQDDDGGPEPLASRVTFQATETTDAIITVVNVTVKRSIAPPRPTSYTLARFPLQRPRQQIRPCLQTHRRRRRRSHQPQRLSPRPRLHLPAILHQRRHLPSRSSASRPRLTDWRNQGSV